jgi:hypothetical protein
MASEILAETEDFHSNLLISESHSYTLKNKLHRSNFVDLIASVLHSRTDRQAERNRDSNRLNPQTKTIFCAKREKVLLSDSIIQINNQTVLAKLLLVFASTAILVASKGFW